MREIILIGILALGVQGSVIVPVISGQEQHAHEKESKLEKLTPELAKRLVVEWGKVSMGYDDSENIETDDLNEDYPRWKEDGSLRQDRELAIRGRVLISGGEGEEAEPFNNWEPGVKLTVARFPDRPLDLTKALNEDDVETVSTECSLSKSGEFLARFSPGEILRPVGKEVEFQVVLSLVNTRWPKLAPGDDVLTQSIAMLKIPGPPAISKTMQIINGAPSYHQEDFNPAKLVRAVNHLVPLGKEKAVSELRDFMKIACRDQWIARRIEENIDTSDSTCVFLIVRLLFECDPESEKLPHIATVPFLPTPEKEDEAFWPMYPVHMEGDLPFLLVRWGALGGAPDEPERHVDWAEKHGRIRTTLLKPSVNPIAAAREISGRPQTQRLYGHPKSVHWKVEDVFYSQAWNILKDVDRKRVAGGMKSVLPVEVEDELDWEGRVKGTINLDLDWDENEQEYRLR